MGDAARDSKASLGECNGKLSTVSGYIIDLYNWTLAFLGADFAFVLSQTSCIYHRWPNQDDL